MLLKSLTVSRQAFEAGTGWQIKPEGACKGDICIPLPSGMQDDFDVRELAGAMNLPLAEEPRAGLYALGPESIGGKALVTAKAPDFELPDLDGNRVKLSSLFGQKIIVYAWAPY